MSNGFLTDLLARLVDLPPEQHAEIIQTELATHAASDTFSTGELSAEVLSTYTAIVEGDSADSDESLDRLEALARVADGLREFTTRQEERAARLANAASAMTELGAQVTAQAAADTADTTTALSNEGAEGDGGNAEGDGADAGEATEELAAEPNPTGIEGAVMPDAADTGTTPANAPSTELVAAMSNTPLVPLGQVPSSPVRREALPKFESFNLIAAADVPGFSVGQQMTGLGELALAWEHRMMPLVTGSINSGRDGDRTRVGIARIKRELPEEFTIKDDSEAVAKVDHACDESRLPGGSLVAAAGWCAPSETLYDLCPIRMTETGLISLPTVVARRGGLRYPGDFDWCSIWGSIGFHLTEAEVIAGTEKPCYEVPCPTEFEECRMDVAGLCLRTPILMERGWPERIEQFFRGAMIVHAHKMNARKLRRMEELSTKVTFNAPPAPNPAAAIADPHGPGMTESVMSILELMLQQYRYSERLDQAATLEMIAPYWLRSVIKSDLRKKLGIDNRWNVTDAQVDAYLRAVGVNPQWVYDWQDAMCDENSAEFGGVIPTKWPDKVKIMLYRAGSFFQLSADVINLDGVYDHASLIQNIYTGLFTEEGFQVCMRCGKSYVIEIPLCPNGLSGGYQLTSCATP